MVGTRTLCPPCGLSTSLRAKRSNPFHSGARRKLDCFVASAFARRRASADKSAPRNDLITFRIQISNSRCAFAFSRRHVARVLRECCPSKEEGSGNAGCALHPRSRVQNGQRKTHTSIQVQRRQSDIPCAMALRLITCSPRRTGLFATVISRFFSQDLTPASGCRAHTSLPYASGAVVLSTISVHRSPPRERDDRDSPLSVGQDGKACRVI